jgi:hypothetical protein
MTRTDAPVRLLSVLVNGSRLDLAVPAGLPVADLVSQAGLRGDERWLRVTGNDGRPIALRQPVGTVLADGDIVIISSESPPAPAGAGSGSARPGGPARTGLLGELALAVAGAAAVALLLVAAVLEHRGQPALVGAARLAVGVLGLAAALGAGLLAAARPRPELGQAVAGLTAFAAGYSISATTMTGHTELAVVLAALACSAVSAVGRSAAAERTEVASVLLVLGIALAVTFGVALQLGCGVQVPAAVLLGLTPAAYRLLPSYSIDVPDEQLIDVERLSVTAWVARTGRRPASRRIQPGEIEQAVGSAQRRVSAAVAALAGLAAALGAVVLTAAGDGLPRWGAALEVALVAIALALLPRTARSTLDKVAPRAAAAVLLLELALLLGTRGSAVASTLGTAALLALGLTAVASAAALGGGWVSVRGSRLADVLEGLCVVLALPAALIAVDAISTFRQLTSH